jgi:hypothetical protein
VLADGVFDHTKHRIELHAHPGRAASEAAAKAKTRKVPPRCFGPVILGVTDMTLKSQNYRITRGAYIRIVGDRVELTGALAAIEFVPADGTAKADLTKVLVNKPSGLMVLVPQVCRWASAASV